MGHYDDYFDKEEREQQNRRNKIKDELEKKFANMSRDEKIDFVVDLVLEDYKHKRIWG